MSSPSIDNGIRYRLEQRSGECWVTYRCGQVFRVSSSAHRQAARIGQRIGEHNIRVTAFRLDGQPL